MAAKAGGNAAMPSWVGPQLATLTHERFSDPEWIFERKLDGELRHPRFQGLRDDKDPREVVRELPE